jgi:hypothetical protein
MSYYIPQCSVVHKHKLEIYQNVPPSPHVKLALPADAEILLFDMQLNDFYIWERHNVTFPKAPMEFEFYLTGTGNPIPDHLLVLGHIGSFQSAGFVWHLFRVSDQIGNIAGVDNV